MRHRSQRHDVRTGRAGSLVTPFCVVFQSIMPIFSTRSTADRTPWAQALNFFCAPPKDSIRTRVSYAGGPLRLRGSRAIQALDGHQWAIDMWRSPFARAGREAWVSLRDLLIRITRTG